MTHFQKRAWDDSPTRRQMAPEPWPRRHHQLTPAAGKQGKVNEGYIHPSIIRLHQLRWRGAARRSAAQRGPFAYYDESGQLVVRPALVRTPAKCDALLDELGRLLCTSAGPAA